MTTAIIYASKYGCAADCAVYLKNNLAGDIMLIDINKTAEQINLEKFDRVIIGGSVYAGKINKKLRAFCQSNLGILTQKKLGLFLCCVPSKTADRFWAANFPKALLDSVQTKKIFGSEARLEKMGLADKLIIKAVTKGDFSNFKLVEANLVAFVAEMAE